MFLLRDKPRVPVHPQVAFLGPQHAADGTDSLQGMRPSADDVLLPDFPKRVFLQPCLELLGIRSAELRGFIIPLDNYDILGLEAVEKRARLDADENIERVRVQSEFRFIRTYLKIEIV